LVQGIDDLGGVIGDLLQGLLGKDIRVRPGRFNRLRIVWPVRRQRRIAGLLEEVRSTGPAARQHPESVDEDDRGIPGRVCRLDLPLSRSEIAAITNSLRSGEKSSRPSRTE